MIRRSMLFAVLVSTCGFASQVATAATIQYSGNVFSESGTPVSGGYVIAGTFAPTFDDYIGTYGDDSRNLNSGAYNLAVADGNFFPIGPGTITSPNGTFSASGITDAPVGTPLWLFAFEDISRDSFTQILASSSNPAWQVPAQPNGSTTLTANDANVFILGASHPQGVALRVIPFPEPSSFALSVLGCFAALGFRNRRNRLSRF
ncbi:MAG: hypothetical protein IID44_07035 [Planctomycetes bacterium]|nr:hypothetical protein [Planctomycetota bacterium]